MKENKKKANGNNYIIPSVIVVTKCRKKGKKLENDKKIFWENVNGEIKSTKLL